MNKIRILLLAVCSISTIATAQIGISKGIVGGLNLSTVGGSDVGSGTNSIAGYAAGVFFEIDLPGPFSVEAEAVYSTKGSKTDLGMMGTITDNYGYLDIPVLLKYHLPLPIVRGIVFAGPSMGFLLSAKRTSDFLTAGSFYPSGEIDIKDSMRKNDIGAVAGVGVELSIIGLRTDVRYSYGISTLDKEGKAKVYNRVLSVYFGFGI